MKQELIKKYAHLIAATGVNVKQGQPVIIQASVDQHAFVTMVMEECYKQGASWVRVEWSDQAQTRLHYQYQSLETLSKLPEWREKQLQQLVDDHPCRICIVSTDPAGLAGIDQDKMQKADRATLPITRKYLNESAPYCQWTIAAVPSPAWAMKVFPGVSAEEAVEKLWKAILATCYVTEDNDPVAFWTTRRETAKVRADWLKEKAFDTLTYKSSNGTDFMAKLVPGSNWAGGGASLEDGTAYVPNLPTEEIFTTPQRGCAEGTLVSTKPLSYQGQLIENFSITFKDGKAVSWKAEKGEDVLGKIITMDEGAAYLGELALVPVSSPISQSGILFYTTLFDENASCHVALGRGFGHCIPNWKNLSEAERNALCNTSMIHVDFMVGAPDMTITGWKDGVPTPIFVNGEWAEEV